MRKPADKKDRSMRKLTWLFLLFFILPSFFSSSYAVQNLEWQSWSPTVFKLAKKEHKLILIFGKVSWCHWCQKMASSTFQDPAVIQLISRSYIPVKVDIEEDLAVGSRYQITEIPSLIILNDQNQELKRSYGYASAQTVISLLSRLSRQYQAEKT